LNQREQLGLEQENEPGTLADIFSGLQTAAKVGSIPMSGGTSLLGLL
jgi:hypothetical protein